MSKFTEEKLEQAILELLEKEGFPHVHGGEIERASNDVLIRDDLREYLSSRYAADGITEGEIERIFRRLDVFSAADLYTSNKTIMKMISDGFLLKREDRNKKDLYVELIDYRGVAEQRPPRPDEASVFGVGFFNSAVHGDSGTRQGCFSLSVSDFLCPHSDNQAPIWFDDLFEDVVDHVGPPVDRGIFRANDCQVKSSPGRNPGSYVSEFDPIRPMRQPASGHFYKF